MYDEDYIIYSFERVLLGTDKKIPFSFVFDGTTKEEKNRIAGVIFRYAIEELLHWTPEQALIYMNREIIEALKLDKVIAKLEIPFGRRDYFDLRSVLQYAYPGRIVYNIEQQAIEEYERVLKIGKWENTEGNVRFPKGFFAGDDGIERAECCFRYAIDRFLGNITPYELYEFFANTSEANKWLKKKRLGEGAIIGFDTPLDMLHYLIEDERSSDLLYMNAKIGHTKIA